MISNGGCALGGNFAAGDDGLSVICAVAWFFRLHCSVIRPGSLQWMVPKHFGIPSFSWARKSIRTQFL